MSAANCRRSPKRKKGFSLLEVMVAGSILLIGIAAVVSALSTANESTAHQRRMTESLHVAEAVMEELLLVPSTSPDMYEGAHGPRTFDGAGNEVSGGAYRASWSVTSGVPIGGMRRVRVTIQWTEPNGERSLSLVTDRR